MYFTPVFCSLFEKNPIEILWIPRVTTLQNSTDKKTKTNTKPSTDEDGLPAAFTKEHIGAAYIFRGKYTAL